ncbi:hypothetical protein WJR50_34140 [Catalinimonas sp. 4WD22]
MIVTLSVSCSEKKFIYYEFDGVTITRIDEEAESYFYYGRCDDIQHCPDKFIWAEYHGLDGVMGGYLVFQKNRQVKFIRMYDHFEEIGGNSPLYLFQFSENIRFINWQDSIKGNYNNIIRIADVLNLEKTLNNRNNSRVKATYPNLEN